MTSTNRSARNHSLPPACLLAVFLLAGMVAAPAAAAPASKTSPRRPANLPATTVQIGEIGSTARVRLRIGDALTVLLPANVTTGYGWQVAANNNALLAPGARTNLPEESGRMGAPGSQKLLFTAKAAGRDHLMLAYARPWEKNAAPARSLTLEVTVAQAGANTASTVTPAGALLARYEGKLPCADCSGIRQAIAFYSSGSAPRAGGYYVETTTYVNAPRGNIANVTAGKWSEKRGMASEPSAVIYALNLDSSGRTENYQLKERGLVPLDSSLHPIQSPYDMTLRQVP